MQRNQHSTEFKEQALSKARTRGVRTLESVAKELNMFLGALKGGGHHADGDKGAKAPARK